MSDVHLLVPGLRRRIRYQILVLHNGEAGERGGRPLRGVPPKRIRGASSIPGTATRSNESKGEQMSEELKPCPFCGGSVHQQGVDNVIKCDACGVTIDIPLSDKQEEAFEHGLVFDNWDIAHVAKFWNTRAAATDEQFAQAVHDGRAWEPARTCRITMCDAGGDDLPAHYRAYRCDACGEVHSRYKHDYFEFCPNCGAKAVSE